MLTRIATLVPLAALSVVWTVDVVDTPADDVSAVAGSSAAQLPAPSSPLVPDAALVIAPDMRVPASVSGDAKASTGTPAVTPAVLSTLMIPSVALAAYQRAATVIDSADQACRLDWTLLAAIGRVESDHGNHAGSTLADDGHATPDIVGPALTGRAGTLRVTDTDAGRLDGDTRFDHAVGPMQFLPSTWSVVGVDADGDGQRDPQDIDDAALAASVYLCSGPEDLSTGAGRQAALLRYNHSRSYVATVLRVAAAYQSGTGLDAGLGGLVTTRTMSVAPAVVVEPAPRPTKAKGHQRPKHKRHRTTHLTGASTHQSQTPAATSEQPPAAQPSRPPTGQPAQPPTDGSGDGVTSQPATSTPTGTSTSTPTATSTGTSTPTPTPTPTPTVTPTPTPTVTPTPTPAAPATPAEPATPATPATPTAATADELTSLCGERVEAAYPEATDEAHDQAVHACAEELAGQTLDDAKAQVDCLVGRLPEEIDGLGPASSDSGDPASNGPAAC